jgi:hypothetical protein
MTEAEKIFQQLESELVGVKPGKMFGCLCLKTPKGKAAAMLWKDELVVKLDKKDLDNYKQLKGVKFFDPMDGRPMKEWLQFPIEYSDQWKDFAKRSLAYVLKEKS